MIPNDFRSTTTGWRPIRKLRTALAGMRSAMLLDFSVLYKVILSAVFLVVAGVFETLFHFLFVLAVTGLMLIAEMVNTAIEALCDYIEPRVDERIKIIKDVAAGATMLAIVIWWVVLLVVLLELLAVTGVTAASAGAAHAARRSRQLPRTILSVDEDSVPGCGREASASELVLNGASQRNTAKFAKLRTTAMS